MIPTEQVAPSFVAEVVFMSGLLRNRADPLRAKSAQETRKTLGIAEFAKLVHRRWSLYGHTLIRMS